MRRILPVLRVLLFALLAATILSASAGCGLKGDLVLPAPAEKDSETEESDA